MRSLKILAPIRYPWRFNSPRKSRHEISIRRFAPFNRISPAIEGVTIFNPWPPAAFDLVHAFNRIPLGRTPYVIGYESHLPRAYGLESSRYYRHLRASLAGSRCRRIIAISRHADAVFRATHDAGPDAEALLAKLEIRYPNVEVGEYRNLQRQLGTDEALRISFVGGHFARKGGCVAVRLAELAASAGLRLEITIVSTLTMGGGIWTDPLREGYFDSWRRRIEHPSITLIPSLSNRETLALFESSHFSLLTTFGDTFGYSAIEAMQAYCPVIATEQGALPEFIAHGRNGYLVPLETSAVGEWIKSSAPDRGTAAFERLFTDEIERMAEAVLAILVAARADWPAYQEVRAAARDTVLDRFDSGTAAAYWDRLYEMAVATG